MGAKVTITLNADGEMEIAIPDTQYSCPLPCTVAGLRVLQSILRARARGETRPGTAGAPSFTVTRQLLAEMTRGMKPSNHLDLDINLDDL